MKKVTFTRYNAASLESLMRWFKKHKLVYNGNLLLAGCAISPEDDTLLYKTLLSHDYVNYSPPTKCELNKGEALVFTEDELKIYIKRQKLLDIL